MIPLLRKRLVSIVAPFRIGAPILRRKFPSYTMNSHFNHGSSSWRFASASTAAALALASAAVLAPPPPSACERDGDMVLFSANANPELAEEISVLLGSQLGNVTVARFADGEVNVQVHDNVRGKDVYIVQPTSPPVNEHLMELLLLVSTMRRASAERITCVIPYYGYARQDRKMTARVPISAADVARLLEETNVWKK